MPTTVLVRKVGRAVGAEPIDAAAGQLRDGGPLGFRRERGPALAALGNRDRPRQVRARGGSVPAPVVVEVLNSALGLTPPPRAFPWQVHARGFAAHLLYRLALGLLLAAASDGR